MKAVWRVITAGGLVCLMGGGASAFEAQTLTNQRTGNFTLCTQGKCQGGPPTNAQSVRVGPHQHLIRYRIGDTPQGLDQNVIAGGTDPGADQQLGVGLPDPVNFDNTNANLNARRETVCNEGVDPRCVKDTNDAVTCNVLDGPPTDPKNNACSSSTHVVGSTAVPKRIAEFDVDGGALWVTDQRITDMRWSTDWSGGVGKGAPTSDIFDSRPLTLDGDYNKDGVPDGGCPPGFLVSFVDSGGVSRFQACRVTRMSLGMTSLYAGGNAGFTSANSTRHAMYITAITNGLGSLIGHVALQRYHPADLTSVSNPTAPCATDGDAATCTTAELGELAREMTGTNGCRTGYGLVSVTISTTQEGGRCVFIGQVDDPKTWTAFGWEKSSSNFSDAGCTTDPLLAFDDFLTCGSWSAAPADQAVVTFRATQPLANGPNTVGQNFGAGTCVYGGSVGVAGTTTGVVAGTVCSNARASSSANGDPEGDSPLCAGIQFGPTNQHNRRPPTGGVTGNCQTN